ncbi:MAG: peptidoglycan-binding protein, partial [Clostridia bacterium]|nr:peptidoglycan-binding protein [Clostridia bacterium]
MKKSFLILLSLVVLLSSVLTVVGAATGDLADDMYDDDANVTYDAGTTATTKGSILGNIGGDGIGDLVGGVVESIFQDEDVSEQVNDKAEGILDGFGNIFDSIKDFIPSTNKQTTGSNFFDPITPAVTGGFNSNFGSGNNVQQNNTLSSTNAAINGEYVDYNTTVIPYTKPTGALNPGDKSDGVKWLQWILIYTECGLQNPITGEYDDATAAAVKTLQLKYGMTVDGIASQEVIEKAEQMYNDYINGISSQSTSSPAVF